MENIIMQDGDVTFFFEPKSENTVIDIEVLPGVKKVVICYDVKMEKSKKTFPDVTELVICQDVSEIRIPNVLFPNVKNVKSESASFVSDSKYLIKRTGWSRAHSYNVLCNTFCKDESEVMDMNGISEIAAYAFTGCRSVQLINTQRCICVKEAFYGSAFCSQPFVNGVKMAGQILIDIDMNADTIILPDEKEPIYLFLSDVSKVKHMVAHNVISVLKSKHYPKRLTLDTAKNGIYNNIESLLHDKDYDGKYVSMFDITEQTEKFGKIKIIDGVVYSSDMKWLIAVPVDIDELEIPDGVENIRHDAFRKCQIKSVKFSDSVKHVALGVFDKCKLLKSVDLGRGLKEIGKYMFSGCVSLRQIRIPEQVMTINDYAFNGSGLEKVELNEGLIEIGQWAFFTNTIHEIKIPKSVRTVGYNAFGRCVSHIILDKYVHDIASTLTSCSFEEQLKIMCLECNEKKIYIPKLVKPSMKNTLVKRVNMCFENKQRYTFFDCAYTVPCRERLAVFEAEMFQDEEAKAYLKKRARKMAFRIMREEEDEDFIVRFLKLGIVSKITMKGMLAIADGDDKAIVKSYLLQILGEDTKPKSKSSFYL